MSGSGYASVSIPVSLISEIDTIVENETLGYKSRSAYIQEAIRNHLSRMRELSIKHTSTGSEGEGITTRKPPAEPAEKPQKDKAAKDTSTKRSPKKRSKSASEEDIILKPEKRNLDEFGIEA